MCDHATAAQLQRIAKAVASARVDHTIISAVYDAYAPAVYGVLQRVLRCEDRACEVLLHTFVKCSDKGANTTLAALFRTAFSSACSTTDAVERPALEGRIKAWYAEVLAERPVREVARA